MSCVLLLSVRATTRLVQQALSVASSKLVHALYVIPHGFFLPSSETDEKQKRSSIFEFMSSVYSTASNKHPDLNVRVSLNLAENMTSELQYDPDVIITDPNSSELVRKLFGSKSLSVTHLEGKMDEGTFFSDIKSSFGVFRNVVLGGTFDRLHTGHKYLLSSALLHCSERLVVGISDGPLVCGKLLEELIEPYDFRAKSVVEFANEVCSGVKCETVAIFEPLGPTATDESLECLVVSQETARGGEKVNQIREKKGLNPLTLEVVELMTTPQSHEAGQKLSSSFMRRQSLGHLRQPTSEHSYVLPWLRSRNIESRSVVKTTAFQVYVIGLTGGIASGKSSIAKMMSAEGAGIIDCDKLGHDAYLPETEAYTKVIETFGSDVKSDDGQINRKALGAIVFKEKAKLQQLCEIVWPEIARLAEQSIEKYATEGKKVCVLDAAVLLEAGWDRYVHEVWVTIIPHDETVRRVMRRDGISEEEVVRRLESQMSNLERVKKADVVLSSLWERNETQQQVLVAMSELQERVAAFQSQQARL